MSKQQNALRLALEALRKARRKVLTTEECHAVIMSIKEALAEQKSGIKQVIELYDSPDQPSQQEPVALDVELNEAACELLNVFTAKQPPDFDEYTQIRLQLGNGHSGHGLYVSLAEYPEEGSTLLVNTTPPQRTWVGLTDEEIKSMDVGLTSNASFYAGALWAAAKLKEKQNEI